MYPATNRLSQHEIDRVRDRHPISEVLRRVDIGLPASTGGDVMISCPTPGHDDPTPSCIIHTATGRYYCFGCGSHGDVFTLVNELTGIRSLTQIAALLDAGGPIGPGTRFVAAVPVAVQRPDRETGTTSLERVLDVNDEAWRYVTYDRLADQARIYLARRGIDRWHLEARTGAPLAGYTPADRRGLVAHLIRRGFTPDEVLDAGWAARHDAGGLVDRFHRRVLFPIRNSDGHLAGVIGRDITGHARCKYLNTAHTVAFDKGTLLYGPLTESPPDATVVVCEGAIDALAIAAADAARGAAPQLVPVAPSGTALTSQQARLIAELRPSDVVICADGDQAGQTAATKWVATLGAAGVSSRRVVLPRAHDPASWLAEHGASSLRLLSGSSPEHKVTIVSEAVGAAPSPVSVITHRIEA